MSGQQNRCPQGQSSLVKSYATRLKTDVKSILENFQEITKLGTDDGNTQLSSVTQSNQDNYEMVVRAENMVRGGESLMKLITDIKQHIILADFPSKHETLDADNLRYRLQADEMDRKLMALREDIVSHLYDLEEEYYMSYYK